ncbi:hypothetical protein [Frigoriglobus tundricola]|uniref:Uncharacterized protein n=1 Tax=Frigoriglobus tundricola TaxID=2774151 RepID=A0A6M5YZS3_9BACT|nr:hypothetical protein [Frigoriglobus tundricola]QJW98432.1 hypothetical protein FTUN_6022 [Frigoriglobus tundricola]
MNTWNNPAFEAEMQARIDRRDGPAAVALLLEDPRNRYASAFNRTMVNVDAAYIGRAYTGPQTTLAAMVTDGRIRDWAHFQTEMTAVLVMSALHYGVKSYHAANPPARRTRQRGKGQAAGPLVVSARFDLNACPARSSGSESTAERAERFRLLLSEARGLGLLHLRVVREVYRYREARGTCHGAFVAVAGRAECDARGRVRRVGAWTPTDRETPRPPAVVVRQVRRLFGEASRVIERRAYLLGYRVSWPG